MLTDVQYRIPIVAHHAPTGAGEAAAERLAERMLVEDPRLRLNGRLAHLAPTHLTPEPALHLDDLSRIPLLDRVYHVTFLQDRARLRAGDGDMVATCTAPCDEFEAYCERRLGLGDVTWLRVEPTHDPLALGAACWIDRHTRHAIVTAIRSSEIRYIHPHMGSTPVWVLGHLLRHKARRPLEVIGPPPYLTSRVNDKVWFSHVVSRLLGADAVLPGSVAWNYSTLARIVAHTAEHSTVIVVKIPDSAGGAGNVVVSAARFRGRPLGAIRQMMREHLVPMGWEGAGPLLVGSWQTNVLCAPSSQLWIPPEEDGGPVIEGIFEQLIENDGSNWIGSVPARLPEPLIDAIAEQSWTVGRLFQHLKYVGRCSFDLLVTGDRLEDSRLRFVECNGRWGGTSLPMTLMNRLLGDWASTPFAAREIVIPGAGRATFADVLLAFEDDLYDARTERGRLVFFNPCALQNRPGIDVIALGTTQDEAYELVNVEVPRRMRALVGYRQ